ncbi:MAG: hypothetical protein CM15mV69_510 [Caudoviricetes sp.]|nr:MAG: hypothetical protein CM15mV69_510 [Caudoviricetes sp.]
MHMADAQALMQKKCKGEEYQGKLLEARQSIGKGEVFFDVLTLPIGLAFGFLRRCSSWKR